MWSFILPPDFSQPTPACAKHARARSVITPRPPPAAARTSTCLSLCAIAARRGSGRRGIYEGSIWVGGGGDSLAHDEKRGSGAIQEPRADAGRDI